MVTVEELQSKRAELEVKYNNLVKLGEQKEEQYKKDTQEIRDALNNLRGEYQAYTDIIYKMQCECDPDGCCNTVAPDELEDIDVDVDVDVDVECDPDGCCNTVAPEK